MLHMASCPLSMHLQLFVEQVSQTGTWLHVSCRQGLPHVGCSWGWVHLTGPLPPPPSGCIEETEEADNPLSRFNAKLLVRSLKPRPTMTARSGELYWKACQRMSGLSPAGWSPLPRPVLSSALGLVTTPLLCPFLCPCPCPSRRATIPGYTGHTHWMQRGPVHEATPPPPPSTTARVHRYVDGHTSQKWSTAPFPQAPATGGRPLPLCPHGAAVQDGHHSLPLQPIQPHRALALQTHYTAAHYVAVALQTHMVAAHGKCP